MDGYEEEEAYVVRRDDDESGSGMLGTEAVAEYLLEHKHLAAAFELYQARS